jgi:hypothetical protein
VAALMLVGFTGLNRPGAAPHVVKGDGEGYYAYLPAYIVDHDPTFRTLVHRRFEDPGFLSLSGLSYQPRTGRYLDKYPAGVAVMTLPFFLAGHGLARLTGQRADGYGRTEELSAGLAAISWAIGGLFALRSLLLRWFTDKVTVATLVCLGAGTGLLHYTAFDSSYSHAFSFAALSLTLLAVTRWFEEPRSWRRAVALGLAVGLVIGIRPANLIAVVPLAAYGIVSRHTLIGRGRLLRRHWRRLLVAVAASSALPVATLLAWHEATGRVLLFSYRQDERFRFLHPHWQVLYSFRPHGLLPYAPVLLLAVVGMVPLWRHHRSWFWPIAAALCADTYLLASWGAWPLGDAFGQRGYVDMGGLFALPLAALFTAARHQRWRWAAGTFAALAVTTTLLGTLAYWQGRLPHQGATPTGYLDAIVSRPSARPSEPFRAR